MSLVVNALLDTANLSIITLCGVVKLPQLYGLIKSKSPAGVSLIGVSLEFTGFCIMMCYNIYFGYHLSSYLEYPLLVIQDLIMLMVLLSFLGLLTAHSIILFSFFLMVMLAMTFGYFPEVVVTIMLNLCTPLSAGSKIVQLLEITSARDSTGVSILSWSISAYTSAGRLFTVYIETHDESLMINHTVALMLNSAIVAAALIYSPKKKIEKIAKKD